ncbi:MAG: DNA transfer protein p32 [Acinetobacter sp.]|nr:DNA transfer protein p32 [Acinetobacter sp.]
MVAAAMVGAAAVGAAGSAYAGKQSSKAAKAQANSADAASQIQWDMYDQTRKDLDPYKQAGDTALNQLMGQMTPDGYFNQTYTGQDIYSDPSYQFRLQQGQDAIQSSAAAQGGLLSGATLKALQNYGQESASQEYSNAYNRFNADQTNRYNRLSNLVGIGQNAAAQVGNAGAQTAQAVANNTMAGANSIAAGQVASANNWANTANNLGSMATSYAFMKNSGVI